MAFGVRIRGYPEASDEPLWSVETPWWNTDELITDPRFKDASWSPGYADYEAVVTPDEAKALSIPDDIVIFEQGDEVAARPGPSR